MGNFRDILRELLGKIIGEPSPQSRQRPSVEDLRPNKQTGGGKNVEQPKQISQQTPITQASKKYSKVQMVQIGSDGLSSKVNRTGSTARDPYFFQIGFDFGTSSSKAIIRDINTNRAWVYTDQFTTNHCSFLIPSVVICQDGNFERHLDAGTLYPENGLYHLKMAAEKVAMGISNIQILTEYKRILGLISSHTPSHITKLACIYLLSSSFSDIISNIIQKFPNYGQNKDDQIAINMAIPVSNISDNRVRSFFERILNISWKLSWKFNSFTRKISIADLAQEVEECERFIIEQGYNELCHVYPEVSANVQAFVRSPASSPDMRTIYFFSDTGAGTVDQSVFTYAGGEDRRLNYFSAGVFSRGSSQIEIAACGDTIDENNLEFWRKEKERGQDSPILNRAKVKVSEGLKADTTKTLKNTTKCLTYGKGGISPDNTLKERIKFIFSGGGHTEFPYQFAVITAYKEYLSTQKEPLITSMARPHDLDVPKGYDHWVNRLYVAYGLSFLFHDLADNTFPSDNKIDKVKDITISMGNKSRQKCSCGGYNKNCLKCYGTGIVQ
ncbi:MAG: hypothetical protein LBU06_07545 [Desulfovibrio sp.]|jgi:hypothetical protein|nr:hypothetical protein [Desulfovibrio sp.]